MTQGPLVSVIVPVYNGEKYLSECLESLRTQTLTDIEVITIDDGSTDSSAAVCMEYAHREPERFRHFSIANSGQSAARNVGLENTRGKYIAFCDADDTYAPHALETLVANIGDCDIAAADFFNKKTKPTDWKLSNRFSIYSPESAIKHTLYQRRQFNTSVSSKLFRAELFEGLRFTKGLYYEDLEIIPRLYARCKLIAVTDGRLYFYRRNTTSFINTWHPHRLDAIRAAETVLEFIRLNYPALEPAARSRRFSAYFNIFTEASRNGCRQEASACYSMIKKERRAILADSRVRLKNKIGALLSYAGERTLRLIAAL